MATSISTTTTTTTTTSSKASKSPTRPPAHLATAELKSRIHSSLSRLADRDTHQIAADELDRLVRTLPADGVPTLLAALAADTPAAPPPAAARRESLRLLALLAAAHPGPTAAHLPRVMAHLARRLRDPASDSSVREACRDAAGTLAALYVRPGEPGPAAGMLVRTLLEVLGEQSKVAQAGAAACLARVVECAGTAGGAPASATGPAFQKLCPRVCKLLSGQSFAAKGALLSVVSSLAQVGAISPQNMQPLLQSVRECLENSDWATRKAAADALSVLASHSSHLVGDGVGSTVTALEACRFDKVKPVRDSMVEALALWKNVAGKEEDGMPDNTKDSKACESTQLEANLDHKKSDPSSKKSESAKDSSGGASPNESDISKGKGSSILEKAAVLLKKKAPSSTDKELNPEFFQKLESRNSDDLPVEVVVPPRCLKSSSSQGDEEPEASESDSRVILGHNGTARRGSNEIDGSEKRPAIYNKMQDDEFARDRWSGQRGFRSRDPKTRIFDADDRADVSQSDPLVARVNNSRSDGHAQGSFMNHRGNWLAIQRQLSQLERQQANLMNMLQDFMGGSHESMITLETRVRGLERVVEEMARDLAVSSGRRGSGMMLGFEGSPGRFSSKYNGFDEYSSSKIGRAVDGRNPFSERYLSSDSIGSGIKGRESSWRSDSEALDSYIHTPSRNGLTSYRRGQNVASFDSRLPRSEQDSGQVGNRRAWDKGQGPLRLGEGPSARSVWQASKDEATLEAIRVAGEDNDTCRTATQGSIRELDAEVLADDNPGQERGPLWDAWTRAMDLLEIDDTDSAYAEVLSTGDDMLLLKLMEISGPVVDQLSSEMANEVLHAVGQFLLEQNLNDLALGWMQQLTDLVIMNGADFLCIPLEGKREILFNLNEASGLEQPEDWEGASPDQMMMQLASAWGINLQPHAT